jgi:predicted nucleic acid-binding protein
MRVLLDTNIVLDFLLDRQPFAEAAEEIWRANEEGRIEAFVSVITPINVFYVTRKLKNLATARLVVESLVSSCQICAPDRDALLRALTLPGKDYEDAVQLVTAQFALLDGLVTRDPDDFKEASLPIYSPTAFLDLLTSS